MTLAFDLSGGSRHFQSPILRFSWEGSFRGWPTVHFRYNLSTCSPPCRSRPGFHPADGDFYFRAFDGLVARSAAGYHYRDNWAIFSGGSFPARTPTSIAATARRTGQADFPHPALGKDAHPTSSAC